jgi:hypothetical protein
MAGTSPAMTQGDADAGWNRPPDRAFLQGLEKFINEKRHIMRTLIMTAAIAATLGLASPAMATQQGAVGGAVTGGVVGAIAGGPVGLVVGAAGGSLMGDAMTSHPRYYYRNAYYRHRYHHYHHHYY